MGLKLGGIVEGIWENILLKGFFLFIIVDQGQVVGPQVPLVEHGITKSPKLGN